MFVDHQEPRTDDNLHLSDKPSVRHSVDLSPGKMAMVRFDVLHLWFVDGERTFVDLLNIINFIYTLAWKHEPRR